MKLSILILTHKRPELFNRCIKSALNNIPQWVEIIVNNDSNDISVLENKQVKYYFEDFNNLSEKYEFLLQKAQGKYIYYLEDDDFLHGDFYKIIEPYLDDADIISGNYYPTWNEEWVLRCCTSQSKKFCIDEDTFQLGQFIFKKSTVLDFEFPRNSHIHNDRKLVEHAVKNSTKLINIPRVIYYQTTDGKDNISFPESSNYHGT